MNRLRKNTEIESLSNIQKHEIRAKNNLLKLEKKKIDE